MIVKSYYYSKMPQKLITTKYWFNLTLLSLNKLWEILTINPRKSSFLTIFFILFKISVCLNSNVTWIKIKLRYMAKKLINKNGHQISK